jgi:hypothetical protein
MRRRHPATFETPLSEEHAAASMGFFAKVRAPLLEEQIGAAVGEAAIEPRSRAEADVFEPFAAED